MNGTSRKAVLLLFWSRIVFLFSFTLKHDYSTCHSITKSFKSCYGNGLYMSDPLNPVSVDDAPPKPKTYTPRKTEASPATPRIYKPKTTSKNFKDYDAKRPAAKVNTWTPRTDNDASRGPAILLSNPQLLVRFRVPREQTDFKDQLIQLQETFQERAESYQSRSNSYDRGGGGGGGYQNDDLFKNFTPAPVASTGFKNGQQKRGPDGKPTGGRPTNEDDRGGRSSKKGKAAMDGMDDDYDEYASDYSDTNESGVTYSDEPVEADYYGDEVNAGLGSVGAGTLQTMDREGLSVEQMQIALYSEYGVKASINAIRKRIRQDMSTRKFNKKTGKTRKDNWKAREARRAGPADNSVSLEEYPNGIQLLDLGKLMHVGPGEILKYMMMNMGQMASMTQTLDLDTAKTLIVAFGKEVAGEGDADQEDDGEVDSDEEEAAALAASIPEIQFDVDNTRAPIVTIMGHVDHGKTTLLDTIRSARVAMGEAGGITQGISAFSVLTDRNDKYVTFIDTPGHAAFSDMRKRGANVTDIVILVVAADDGIMDQTKECIAAVKAANCPIVVAINKMDKEGADPNRIKTDLMSFGVLLEEFGGDVQCVEISAKQNTGIDTLLDTVMVQAEIMNLPLEADVPVMGSVIEARVDKGLGVVVTALIQKGTLKIGDLLLAGPSFGRVRRMINDQKQDTKEAGPSTPVQIVGMTNVPNAGDQIIFTTNEADTKEVAMARMRLNKQAMGAASKSAIMTQASGFAGGTMDNREVLKVPLLVKGDVSGSVEALLASLLALEISDEETVCKIDIVYSSVGDVTSSDVAIAAAAKAKIIAFNVAAGFNAMEEARSTNVEIGYYNVVYELLEEMENKVKVTLAPPPPGKLIGRAEILKSFRVGKSGKVAGCNVLEGMIKMESKVRILRGKRNPVYTGTMSGLKVVKDTVTEVPAGSECGLGFVDFADFQEGDIVECFSSAADED